MTALGPVTRTAKSDATSITVRGKDLADELMGHRSFTEMTYFLTVGRMPNPGETAVLDACLVSLMEHGWTPTSIITRLAAHSVPDDTQVAIAAGLLAVGPVFAGTMEGCAEILLAGEDDAADVPVWAERVAREYLDAKRPLPGFGHRVHKPVDPRSVRLLEIAAEHGIDGPYLRRLKALGEAVDAVRGKPLPVNATGVIAALFLEIGIPLRAARGMATVSRAAGLLGHIVEEHNDPSARTIWQLTREGIPYSEEDPTGGEEGNGP
ncbi:citryl-CoA lyase [Arthrobacter sulfonylureivorans]|uniref:citrate synthase (unknown stereospecificity) n=1 Tax=Arthrobacter sulfonylureivorans TaxID=2486855 RepID=A0ABY3W6Q5_9MICC|nr:citryl-CoA lyase [Arthrobacter sulfonylureivorans]UNK45681.1 citryl-CoA lyase [Arthrobacter sulfonylureivorans]